MCLSALHSRDVTRAWQTAGKNVRYRRRKDRAESCRAMEEVGDFFGVRRLVRLAGKIEARAR